MKFVTDGTIFANRKDFRKYEMKTQYMFWRKYVISP